MDEKVAELTKAWMTKGRNDLDTARLVSGSPEGHLDAAIYHCQQGGEKALKAFIAAQGQNIQRTHDLKRLLAECITHEPSFSERDADAKLLAPLVSSFRYPDEAPVTEPTREEFDEALAAAQRIYDFVLSQLPKETHPV